VRQELLTQISTNISAYTNFGVSTEIPWNSGDVPLYTSNMKTVYVDVEQVEFSELYPVVNGNNVDQTDTVITVFVSVDAKNAPANLSSVLSGIRSAKDLTTVDGIISRTVDMTSDIEDDVSTYTFNFRFITL
jgi:hypothetical protein